MRFNLDSNPSPQPIPQNVSSPEAVASFKLASQKIDELRKELDEKMRQLREQFRQDFSKIAAEFFAAVPRIKSLTWTQYTPYFMDGDPCEFGVNDIFFATDENTDFEYYREFDEKDGNFSVMSYGLKKLVTKEELELCEKMSQIIHTNSELMEDLFGDHVIIVLGADGTKTQAYDHD